MGGGAFPAVLHASPDGDQAGLEGQQRLADSFLVARANGGEAPQAIYVNRELDLDVWQLADKVLTPNSLLSLAAAGGLLHVCFHIC